MTDLLEFDKIADDQVLQYAKNYAVVLRDQARGEAKRRDADKVRANHVRSAYEQLKSRYEIPKLRRIRKFSQFVMAAVIGIFGSAIVCEISGDNRPEVLFWFFVVILVSIGGYLYSDVM